MMEILETFQTWLSFRVHNFLLIEEYLASVMNMMIVKEGDGYIENKFPYPTITKTLCLIALKLYH